ncbi:hypothetical protein [Parafrankia sp. FMc2]|uniref:hypothetical protein n=1 Tax=Parafrankia sp. FMc2 TaxID=3233196 RepID=UPI0034D414BD
MRRAPLTDFEGPDLVRRSGLPPRTAYPILAQLDAAGWLVRSPQTGETTDNARAPQERYRLTEYGANAARDAFARPRPAALLCALIAGAALGTLIGTGAHYLGVGTVVTGVVTGVCGGSACTLALFRAYPGTNINLGTGSCISAAVTLVGLINLADTPDDTTFRAFPDTEIITGAGVGVAIAVGTPVVLGLVAIVIAGLPSMAGSAQTPPTASPDATDHAGAEGIHAPDIVEGGPSLR